MKKIGIRLISFVGIRDKFFSRYFEEGVVFDEGIELSLLSGGIEEYDRCQWINPFVQDVNYNDNKDEPTIKLIFVFPTSQKWIPLFPHS